MSADRTLIRRVTKALREARDDERAEPMRAYMKSEMPFLGVATPVHRKLCKKLYDDHPLVTFDAWQDTMLGLWRQAKYREERYAAINLGRHRRYKPFHTTKALNAYEEMVVTGAWWDLVDGIATHRFVDIFELDEAKMARKMTAWSKARDKWKRRASILSQIKRKEKADLELLFSAIERAMADEDFFLRKGIGWALREHGKTFPDEVIRFVESHDEGLSPLSKKEALRNLI